MFSQIETQSQHTNMIVCICRGASDRDIRAAIQGGARCVDTLEGCGIGGDCGGCHDTLREMLVELRRAPERYALSSDTLSA
jgi:bacterioferritin-associated ferredoxin